MLIRSFPILCLVLLAGCTTNRQTFEGQDADELWTAMVAVAKTPNYSHGEPRDRWTMRENQVWVDEEANRIEVFRRLERVLYRPASKPLHQDREWKFQVMLERRDPPVVMFKSRNAGVPSHAWDEADRFFAEVRDVLAGAPEAVDQQSE